MWSRGTSVTKHLSQTWKLSRVTWEILFVNQSYLLLARVTVAEGFPAHLFKQALRTWLIEEKHLMLICQLGQVPANLEFPEISLQAAILLASDWS